MNRNQIFYELYDAVHRLPIGILEREGVCCAALRGLSIDGAERSAYCVHVKEGGVL